MFWKAFSVGSGQLTGFFLGNKSFKYTHVFNDLTLTIADAMLIVEPVFEDALIWIQGINYRIRVALFVLSKDWDVTLLSNFEEKFA